MRLRKSSERGHFNHGWLETYHTFSFAEYDDPAWQHFRHLRVINEDYVAPGQGFGMHPHRDMEIVTVILSGALRHQDSMGNTSVIRPGEVQRMSAGTGVLHSEVNDSPSEPVHLLQIWILPDKKGVTPGYEQKSFPEDTRRNRLQLAASGAGSGAVKIHQDAALYVSLLENNHTLRHELRPGRHAWIQLTRGQLEVNGTRLGPGDGAGISEESIVTLKALENAHFLLFDLA